MEPKTYNEHYQEGMKFYKGQEDCLYCGIIRSNWDTSDKIEVYSNCELDCKRNKCEGKCSRYVKKTFKNRSLYLLSSQKFIMLTMMVVFIFIYFYGETHWEWMSVKKW